PVLSYCGNMKNPPYSTVKSIKHIMEDRHERFGMALQKLWKGLETFLGGLYPGLHELLGRTGKGFDETAGLRRYLRNSFGIKTEDLVQHFLIFRRVCQFFIGLRAHSLFLNCREKGEPYFIELHVGIGTAQGFRQSLFHEAYVRRVHLSKGIQNSAGPGVVGMAEIVCAGLSCCRCPGTTERLLEFLCRLWQILNEQFLRFKPSVKKI